MWARISARVTGAVRRAPRLRGRTENDEPGDDVGVSAVDEWEIDEWETPPSAGTTSEAIANAPRVARTKS